MLNYSLKKRAELDQRFFFFRVHVDLFSVMIILDRPWHVTVSKLSDTERYALDQNCLIIIWFHCAVQRKHCLGPFSHWMGLFESKRLFPTQLCSDLLCFEFSVKMDRTGCFSIVPLCKALMILKKNTEFGSGLQKKEHIYHTGSWMHS